MITKTSVSSESFTFPVDDVVPGRVYYETVKIHERLNRILKRRIESCHDYHTEVCSWMDYQPLLAAVHTAYCYHLPLTLSPDAVWLTISQGVAQHMAIHGEKLRSRFVTHAGKIELTVAVNGWVRQSPENPWDEALEGWTDQIRDHVGQELHDNLLCNFSTSDKASQMASRIVMMDIFETYFKYKLAGICGIPNITLRGTEADWRLLSEKVRALRCFDMDWWLDTLEPLVDAIAETRSGKPNVEHWKNICKRTDAYGGDIINGWIAYFFPYIRESGQGPCKLRNPIFETGQGFHTFSAPTGLSEVPFVWEQDGNKTLMNAVGGLVGVRQDSDTFGLEPIAGWAICEAAEINSLVHQVRSLTSHAMVEEQAKDVAGIDGVIQIYIPDDLEQLLVELGEFPIKQNGSGALAEFIVPKPSDMLDWGENVETGFDDRGPFGRTWMRIANLSNEQFLAINLDVNRPRIDSLRDAQNYGEGLAPICVCSEATIGTVDANPIVAKNFPELAERLLSESVDSGYYWNQAAFKPYGDANEITRLEKFVTVKKRTPKAQ